MVAVRQQIYLWKRLLDIQGLKCKVCGEKARSVHCMRLQIIVPTNVGGEWTVGNCLLSCVECAKEWHRSGQYVGGFDKVQKRVLGRRNRKGSLKEEGWKVWAQQHSNATETETETAIETEEV